MLWQRNSIQNFLHKYIYYKIYFLSHFLKSIHQQQKNAAMKHHDVSAARQKTSGAALVKLLEFVILSCHLSAELSSQSEFPHLFPTSRPSCLKNEGNDALALH